MNDKTRVENIGWWRPIPGFEHYFISKDGLVYNSRTRALKKSGFDHKGYKRVRLIDGRKRGATKKVHRLVAQAFVDGYSEGLQVNHKDCLKHNNYYKNLEMVTQSKNTKHAWENGRMKLTAKNEKGVFVKI